MNKARVAAIIAALLLLFYGLWRPLRISANSPQGDLTVVSEIPSDLFQLTYISLYGNEKADPHLRLHLDRIDNHSQRRIRVVDRMAGGLLGDGPKPVEVIWRPDGRAFFFIFRGKLNVPEATAYTIQSAPFSVRETDDARWVKPILQQRLDGDDEQRDVAQRLLERPWLQK